MVWGLTDTHETRLELPPREKQHSPIPSVFFPFALTVCVLRPWSVRVQSVFVGNEFHHCWFGFLIFERGCAVARGEFAPMRQKETVGQFALSFSLESGFSSLGRLRPQVVLDCEQGTGSIRSWLCSCESVGVADGAHRLWFDALCVSHQRKQKKKRKGANVQMVLLLFLRLSPPLQFECGPTARHKCVVRPSGAAGTTRQKKSRAERSRARERKTERTTM